MNKKRGIFISILFLIVLAIIAFASQFMDDTQEEFNLGTYTNTTYNGSAIVLSRGNLSGTYTSNVFDAGSVSWNSISWTADAPYGQELPDNKAMETVMGGANMTGNVLLLHMNEVSGTIVDYSGEGNNGAQSGGVTYNSPGKLRTALSFDGSNDYINCGNDASLNIRYAITFEAWIKPDTLSTVNQNSIVSKYQSYWFFVSKERKLTFLRFNANDPETGYGKFTTLSTDATIPTGTWTHVAATYDTSASNQVKLYINGQLSNSTNFANGPIDSTTNSVTIGIWSGLHFFDGTIDEVAVFNRSLSATEILNIYKIGALKLNVSVRSCDDGSCSGENWIDINDNSPQNLTVNNNTYFQYKFDFETDNSSYSPELYNVTIDYTLLNRLSKLFLLNLIPTYPKTTNDLTCSFIITDEDVNNSLTANITWYKDSAVYSSISQSVTNGTQTSSMLDSSNTAKNEEWNCTVIPYDGTAYGTENSLSVTIQNSPPTSANISLNPGSLYTNDDLNVVFNQVSQDDDSDTITYTYQWYKDNVLQVGITGSTVSSGVTSKNELWLVNVTPNDGEENGHSVQENVTILNTIPYITSTSITPTTAYEATTLTASTSGWSDLDNDPEQYTYQWFNQDGEINATTSTLTGTYFNKSDQIYCNVTPYDADDYGTSKSTNIVTIQNSLPTLTIGLVADLGINGTDEDLIGSFIYSDADSDAITNNQTKWYKDDIEQTNLRNLTTISYTNTSADDIWIFSARAYDGTSWSNWFNSSSLTILDISQTYPVLLSPSNGTYFNISNVVLTYTTPNYVNMNCTIFADSNPNPISPIKNNTNIQTRTTIIYNWRNLADDMYYWKAGCTNESILFNSTIRTFTIDTTYPTTAPNLTQVGVSDSDKDGNIELNWTVDSDANSYNIYRSLTQITDATDLTKIGSTSSTSWEDNTTLHNDNYWYSITTVDPAGNENKSIVLSSFNATANDTIRPKIPTSINASSLNGITTIYWTKVKEDVNGNSDELNLQYKIWYKQDSTVNLSKSLVNETADYIKTVSQDSCSGTVCQTTHSLSSSLPYYYFITTIDDANNENSTLDNSTNGNFANVTATTTPPSSSGDSSGGSGGGDGGSRRSGASIPRKECEEEWSCSEWYSCVNGVQARTCVDINNCGTEKNKPEETRSCGICQEKWQCGDWTPCVNNRQTRVCIDKNDCGTEKNKSEEERDCMLDTCSDRIKNFGEVGIDCGGPCRPCSASDFITGEAIHVKETKGPNPFLLIPTIFLLISFIVIGVINKSDIKFRKIVSALHLPMMIVILGLFFLSFFGAKITGLFTAGNETIKEKPLDIENTRKNETFFVSQKSLISAEIEGIAENTSLSSSVEFNERKAKITSIIFLLIISLALISFIVKKRFQTKFRLKKKLKEIKKIKLRKKEKELPIDSIDKIKVEPEKLGKEEPFDKKIEETKKEPIKQRILGEIKGAYKLNQIK